MRTTFRQGLVSSEINANSQPNYLTVNNSGITLRAVNRPIVFTLAEGTKNYTITFHTDVLAWPTALFNGVDEAWLWIDVNKANATRSYGITTKPLVYGTVAPNNPTIGQHWYDRTRNAMRVFNENGSWQQVLRVFAGHYTTTVTSPSAYGTQVGLTSGGVSGEILRDGSGRALTDSSGSFLTTEDVVLIDGASTHAAKLEANVNVAPAAQPIAAYHVVRYNDDGWVVPADYDDTGDCVLGLSVVDAVIDEPVGLVLQGKVNNPMWNWSRANITLWVGQNGELVDTDPFDMGGRAKRRVPVARTVDATTIIFDQGLGGVGEKGEPGDIENMPLATSTQYGAVRLSVEPDQENQPIAVGVNDPRLTDPRTPLEHTHPATAITVSPFGTFNGANAQQALEHLQNVKLNLSGGTVTGPVVSTVQATQDNHLVTLGQAKNEITARAVTERRYVLNDDLPTIVQAFNALTPIQRTLPVNTVVILEWRGETFMWAGGYGAPVAATDSGQFLLLGKLSGGDGEPLSFRTIESIAVYQGGVLAPDLYIAYVAEGIHDWQETVAVIINLSTGSQVILDLPVGEHEMIQRWETIHISSDASKAWACVSNQAGDYNFIAQYSANGDTWSLDFVNSIPGTAWMIRSSEDNSRLAVGYTDQSLDNRYSVTVFEVDTWTTLLHVPPVITTGYYQNYQFGMDLSPDGSKLAVSHEASPVEYYFRFSYYDVDTGTELIRYSDIFSLGTAISNDGGLLAIWANDPNKDFWDRGEQRLYVFATDNIPPSIPQTPTYVFPQYITAYENGRFVNIDGTEFLVGSAFDADSIVDIIYRLNLTTFEFETRHASNGNESWTPFVGRSGNTAVVKYHYDVDTNYFSVFLFDVGLLEPVEPETVLWSSGDRRLNMVAIG